MRLDKIRKIQKRRDDRDTGNWCLMKGYAHESIVAGFMFKNIDTHKPKWAVRALVMLRDAGVCDVCRSKVDMDARVVKRIPAKCGGKFNEPNCICVCKECYKCWDFSKYFYTSPNYDKHVYEQYIYVLKRRQKGVGGSKKLNRLEHQRLKDLMSQLEYKTIRYEEEIKKSPGSHIDTCEFNSILEAFD